MVQIIIMYLLTFLCGQKQDKRKAFRFMITAGLSLLAVSFVAKTLYNDYIPNFNINKAFKSLLIIDPRNDSEAIAADHWQSNAIRIGAQLASIQIGLHNFWFGVGFGQLPFLISKELPTWSIDWEEFRDPFSSTGIHARLFAETGFIGLLLWLVFWFLLMIQLYKIIAKNTKRSSERYLASALLVIGVGLFLCGFSHDSFAFFEYWVYFGASLATLQQKPALKPFSNDCHPIKRSEHA